MTDKRSQIEPERTNTTPGASTSVEHTAPEDYYASGGQHNEQKQDLKKSVKQQQAEPPVEPGAGQHSTGSFTGTTGGDSTASRK